MPICIHREVERLEILCCMTNDRGGGSAGGETFVGLPF